MSEGVGYAEPMLSSRGTKLAPWVPCALQAIANVQIVALETMRLQVLPRRGTSTSVSAAGDRGEQPHGSAGFPLLRRISLTECCSLTMVCTCRRGAGRTPQEAWNDSREFSRTQTLGLQARDTGFLPHGRHACRSIDTDDSSGDHHQHHHEKNSRP